MLTKNGIFAAAILWALALALVPASATAAKAKQTVKAVGDGRAECYACHDEVRALKERSKHDKLACTVCHGKFAAHMEDPEKHKPSTVIDPQLCGKCHRNQLESFYHVTRDGGARKEKGVPGGRSPLQDKLLAPHGFTFEHNEPRGHAFMVIDQFVVDRFQGGRFQFKEGWRGIDKPGKTWEVLTDRGAGFRLKETAMAGNPTCIQCKSSDHILKWKFMGDKDPRAKWDRTSQIVDIAKDTHNPVGCIHCHDPHGTQPRVVRDALIQAIERDRKNNIFSQGGQTDLNILAFRDDFRKIGIMKKTDSRLLCAQCHVEYNCNSGMQWSDGKPVGYADQRTNHFPLKNALALLQHYKALDFFDFRHAVTGARLIKLQHPEAETYAGSRHDKAGVQCHQCHMPKQRGKDGKLFSTHGVVKPKLNVKASCLGCHKESTAEQKLYQIESIINYTRGKMRKSEYWLGQLIDTYALAERMGVAPPALDQAREKHEVAHVLWEYWTAENSDGFHNPDLARESLAESIAASKAGVKILQDAMASMKK